jgi:hypothetical protein
MAMKAALVAGDRVLLARRCRGDRISQWVAYPWWCWKPEDRGLSRSTGAYSQ